MQLRQKGSRKIVVYQRLHMLWLLKECQAKTLVEAAKLVGVSERSAQRWWKLYREKGFENLLRVELNKRSRLSAEQQHAIIEEAGKGKFATVAEIAAWVKQSFGISYTEAGMWKLVRRLKIRKKTARLSHVKKDQEAVEHFKSDRRAKVSVS